MHIAATNPVLGITGGIATGKSTVAQMFRNLGAGTVSADSIARDVLAPGSQTSRSVIDAFGMSIVLNGEAGRVDRAKLGELIFRDNNARERLNQITHPVIHKLLAAEIERYRHDESIQLVTVEIPLLFENGLESFVDKVLVVICSETNQIQRILARNPHLSADDALSRIHSQLPLSDKTKRADYIIDTEKPQIEVEDNAARLYDLLRRN
jgi:dephospho-CoA kinase